MSNGAEAVCSCPLNYYGKTCAHSKIILSPFIFLSASYLTQKHTWVQARYICLSKSDLISRIVLWSRTLLRLTVTRVVSDLVITLKQNREKHFVYNVPF